MDSQPVHSENVWLPVMEHNPNLKIHIEEDESQVSLDSRLNDVLPVAKLLGQQFSAMTGWVLNYSPTDKAKKSFSPDSNLPVFGQFETVDMAPNVPHNQTALHRGQCDQLLDSINTILRRLETAELALWQQQHYADDASQTFQDFQFPSNDSDVLASLLKNAAQTLSATGAALYLLDDETTQLNLRATIGPVSAARQMQTVRPLEHALADLEALVGSVVTITDPLIGESWKIPEPYKFGVCLMLGEPSLPLGTVWFFFETAREATRQEMLVLEDMCEKIGNEIHSRGKGRQVTVPSPIEQELQLTAKLNDCRLPSYAPEIDGWKVTGWTYRQEALTGVFHEWAVTPSGQLSVAVGQVAGPMLPATINANNLRSLICAHRDYRHNAKSMVAKLNENVWNNSPGDALASLLYVLVDPETNTVQAVNAGDGGMVFGNKDCVQSIDQFQNPLGADLDLPFEQWQKNFDESDTLVLFSQGLRNALSETMNAINDAELLSKILMRHAGNPQAILQAIEDSFFQSDFQHVAGDLSVVVLTRSSQAEMFSVAAAEELRSIEAEFASGDADLLRALEDEIAALERMGFVRPNRNVIEPGSIEIEADDLYGDDVQSYEDHQDGNRNNWNDLPSEDLDGSDHHPEKELEPESIDVDVIADGELSESSEAARTEENPKDTPARTVRGAKNQSGSSKSSRSKKSPAKTVGQKSAKKAAAKKTTTKNSTTKNSTAKKSTTMESSRKKSTTSKGKAKTAAKKKTSSQTSRKAKAAGNAEMAAQKANIKAPAAKAKNAKKALTKRETAESSVANRGSKKTPATSKTAKTSEKLNSANVSATTRKKSVSKAKKSSRTTKQSVANRKSAESKTENKTATRSRKPKSSPGQ